MFVGESVRLGVMNVFVPEGGGGRDPPISTTLKNLKSVGRGMQNDMFVVVAVLVGERTVHAKSAILLFPSTKYRLPMIESQFRQMLVAVTVMSGSMKTFVELLKNSAARME
jgi:hypothetical protein